MSLEITKSNFDTEVLQSTSPVLVDFWAPWCGPCRMLGPVIEQIATENDAIKVGKINVDEQQALAQQFGVATIPTVIVFKNGKEAGRSVGLVPKEKLLALV
ncbi:MAG: thioredoxin [Ruthenibacterium sp.]